MKNDLIHTRPKHFKWNDPSGPIITCKSYRYYSFYLYSFSPKFSILKLQNIPVKIKILIINQQNIYKLYMSHEMIISWRKYTKLIQCYLLPYNIKSESTIKNNHEYYQPFCRECTAESCHHCNYNQNKYFCNISQIFQILFIINRNE